jgi:hypothetical protein
MTMHRSGSRPADAPAAQAPVNELIEQLARFQGPPEDFLPALLHFQCRYAPAASGAILRVEPDGNVASLATYPRPQRGESAGPGPDAAAETPPWLARAAAAAPQAAGQSGSTLLAIQEPTTLYGQPAEEHVLLVPLAAEPARSGVAAYLLEQRDARALAVARERLELTTNLLNVYSTRLQLQRRQEDLSRLEASLDTLNALNAAEKFSEAAMALCNELASRWHCSRVSAGFLKGRYVQVRATSHTEKITRKMEIIQRIEAAMEECLDQDREILVPADETAEYACRDTRELARRAGPASVLSVPLRRGGEVRAVLTFERPVEEPFTAEEVEILRLACELCTPRLLELQTRDRWWGRRAADAARSGLAALLGPKHTWAKLIALAAAALILFAVFARGTDWAEGTFETAAVQRRVVPARVAAPLRAVHVELGERVSSGQLLAELDTTDLRLELEEARSQRASHRTEAAKAREEGKIAEAKIASARAQQAQARIDLLEQHIRWARLLSPIDGTVLPGELGELESEINAPIETGQVLFEVAPLRDLRAELKISADRIVDVNVGDRGELAATAFPADRVGFTVTRIDPLPEEQTAEGVYYRVVARLDEVRPWMRPGLQGSARIDTGRSRYCWLWTRAVIHWIRMKLWL